LIWICHRIYAAKSCSAQLVLIHLWSLLASDGHVSWQEHLYVVLIGKWSRVGKVMWLCCCKFLLATLWGNTAIKDLALKLPRWRCEVQFLLCNYMLSRCKWKASRNFVAWMLQHGIILQEKENFTDSWVLWKIHLTWNEDRVFYNCLLKPWAKIQRWVSTWWKVETAIDCMYQEE